MPHTTNTLSRHSLTDTSVHQSVCTVSVPLTIKICNCCFKEMGVAKVPIVAFHELASELIFLMISGIQFHMIVHNLSRVTSPFPIHTRSGLVESGISSQSYAHPFSDPPPPCMHTHTHTLRHVMLPKEIAKLVPKGRLMSEKEWRQIGVQQSPGWIHYMIHGPEPHVLLFRRPITNQQAALASRMM